MVSPHCVLSYVIVEYIDGRIFSQTDRIQKAFLRCVSFDDLTRIYSMKIAQRGGAYLNDNCKITLIKAFVKHWASWVKLLPHWSHLKGFSLLWIIWWSNKFLLIIESNFQFLLMSIYTQGMKNLIPSLASLPRTEVSLTWSWGVYILFDFVHC